MMQLRDGIDKILRAKKWTQAQLGQEIGVTQSMVSKMRLGPDWEQHWQVCLKLLKLADEVGVPLRKRRGEEM